MNSRQLLPALAAALVLGACPVARAFQSPGRFLEPPETGGGGGRFYTGSPVDRYTCKVCHTVGTPVQLHVQGLPVDGYLPGHTYPMRLDWDDSLSSVAFNLEMTDGAGRALGVFSVPPADQLSPDDLCTSTGTPATVATPGGQRSLVLMSECGAHQSTFSWTAPSALPADDDAAREAWFSGSLVSSDKDGTVKGDAVTDFSRVFAPVRGGSVAATVINGGCQVLPHARAAGRWQLVSFVWIALALWLRRSRKPAVR